MRWGLVFWGLIVLVAVAAIVALCLRPATVIGTSEKSLAYSLRSSAGSEETGRCEEREEDRFACTVIEGDERVGYLVKVDDYGCWDAATPGGGPSETLNGCVTIRDLVRLSD